MRIKILDTDMPLITGEFYRQSSVDPGASCTVEPLEHGSISPQVSWRSVEASSTGGLRV